MKTIQDLKTEFNREIEILKRIQAEMKIKLKNPITHLENWGFGRFTSIMGPVKIKISSLEDKIKELEHKQRI